MIDFIICYEHMNREIENDALLKFELNKRGYSCKIIHFNGPGFFSHSIFNKARVVVTPWLRYDDNVFHYLCLARKPYKLVNLQCEQVYSIADIESGMVSISEQAKKAYHICWGKNSKERLISAGVNEELLTITGAIQLDYGCSILQNYFFNKEKIAQEFGLDSSKNWILLISSFAYANYGDKAIKKLETQFNYSLDENVKLHKISQLLTLDWVEQLLQTVDCEFIYRPHPSENITERIKVLESKYNHFHVISKYSVKQWVKVCEKINIWISTSNAEILSMGGDFAIVRPIPIPDKHEVESMRGEAVISDCDSFIRYNSDILTVVKDSSSEKMSKLSNYYLYNSEYPAYINVANFLEQLLKTNSGETYHFSLKQYCSYSWLELKKRIISLVMELGQKQRLRFIITKIPLKTVIKSNIIHGIEKSMQAKLLEKMMIDYLTSMGDKCAEDSNHRC